MKCVNELDTDHLKISALSISRFLIHSSKCGHRYSRKVELPFEFSEPSIDVLRKQQFRKVLQTSQQINQGGIHFKFFHRTFQEFSRKLQSSFSVENLLVPPFVERVPLQTLSGIFHNLQNIFNSLVRSSFLVACILQAASLQPWLKEDFSLFLEKLLFKTLLFKTTM